MVTIVLLVVASLTATAFAEEKPEYPALIKKVDGRDSTSAAAGENVSFTLTSSIPADLWKCFDFGGDAALTSDGSAASSGDNRNLGTTIDGAEYNLTFHDRMNRSLTMTDDGISVYIGKRELSSNQYVYVSSAGDNCSFHVTLDLVGLYEAGVITDDDYAAQTEIVVAYEAALSENASAGKYENVSFVSWEKKIVNRKEPTDPVIPGSNPSVPSGPDSSEEDEVYVYTYKIKLVKLDKNDDEKRLAGAEFKLETDDGSWTDSKVTGADGIVEWDGLKEGSYSLTEVTAPDGYVKDATPVTIAIPDDAGDADFTATVRFMNGQAPSTGGSGTVLYTIAGLAILGGAAVLFVISRKKSRD